MLKKYIRSIVLVCSFEHTVKNMNTLEARRYKCIIQSGFFSFLFLFFVYVCVSLALMENKLATVLGCLPETTVTSGAFFPLVICSFVDKDCGEVKQ